MKPTRQLAVVVSLAAFAGRAGAQGGEGDPWQWSIAPYLLMPKMSGTVQVAGLPPLSVDASANQIFSHLQTGAMLYVQAQKGNWSIAVDGIYMDLSQPYQPSGIISSAIAGSVGTKQGTLEGLVFYRLESGVEVAIGARANSVRTSATYTYLAPGAPPGGPVSVSGSTSATWGTPVIGARWTPLDGEMWRVVVFGDIGALNSDNKSWQLVPSVGYQFSRLVQLSAQYRMMSVTYRTGGTPDAFAYQMKTFGPEIALGFSF